MPKSVNKQAVLSLLSERYYLPLFLTQFFGAFNDNAFKLAILTLISYQLSYSQQQSEFYQALAGGIFTVPFFIFSATAGQLADKYNKSIMIRWIKLWEVLLMILGGFGLYYRNIGLMMTILAGMGVHSTFFGPIKYSILPEHVPQKRLLGATALIEASTFIAILTGTVMGSLSVGSKQVWMAILLTNGIAWAGFCSCWFIPSAPMSNPDLSIDWNLPRATWLMLKQIFNNRPVVPVILAISWFWLIGVVMLIKLPDYTHYVLKADQQVFAVFLALFSIGIALGALSISRLQRGTITLEYVALIMLLVSIFAFDLYQVSSDIETGNGLSNLKMFLSKFNHWRIMFDFFSFSFAGGMFVVPLYTYLQVHGLAGEKSRTIAANNIVNAIFMVFGSLLVMLLLKLDLSISGVFLTLAVLNCIAAIAFGWAFYTQSRIVK